MTDKDRIKFAKETGKKLGETAPRPISIIAAEIRADWKTPYFGAVPYLDALSELSSIKDMYGAESAKSVVLYFLSNARTWRGPVAAHIKAELKAMVDSTR